MILQPMRSASQPPTTAPTGMGSISWMSKSPAPNGERPNSVCPKIEMPAMPMTRATPTRKLATLAAANAGILKKRRRTSGRGCLRS